MLFPPQPGIAAIAHEREMLGMTRAATFTINAERYFPLMRAFVTGYFRNANGRERGKERENENI